MGLWAVALGGGSGRIGGVVFEDARRQWRSSQASGARADVEVLADRCAAADLEHGFPSDLEARGQVEPDCPGVPLVDPQSAPGLG